MGGIQPTATQQQHALAPVFGAALILQLLAGGHGAG